MQFAKTLFFLIVFSFSALGAATNSLVTVTSGTNLNTGSIVVSNLTASAMVAVDSGKKSTSSTLTKTEADALHGKSGFITGASGEINALTSKATPVSDDLLVIEDSAASNAKKKITIGSLPAGSSGFTNVINVTFDGGAAPIATGVTVYRSVPYDCTVTGIRQLADRSGSITVDVYKCSYANFDAGATHPVSGDKITASAPATISSATKSDDTTLTGWTTSLSAGDVLAFVVTGSPVSIQRDTVILTVKNP